MEMGLSLYNVKSKVERLTCSTHGKHPVIKVVGSNLNFECCCETFKSKCVQETQKALAEDGKKMIEDTLNKAFKKFR